MNWLIIGAALYFIFTRTNGQSTRSTTQWLEYYGENPDLLPPPTTGVAKADLITLTSQGSQSAESEAIERIHGTWAGIFESAAMLS